MMERAKNSEQQAFLTFLYLTGSRVSEALLLRYRDFVRVESTKIGKIPIVAIPVLKRRDEFEFREIPLWLDKEEGKLGRPLVKWVNAKYDLLEPDLENADEMRIWKHTRTWAFDICKQVTGKSPHYWRHHRAQYLATVKGFNEYMLTSYFNWANPQTSYIYTKGKNPRQFLREYLI